MKEQNIVMVFFSGEVKDKNVTDTNDLTFTRKPVSGKPIRALTAVTTVIIGTHGPEITIVGTRTLVNI